MLLLTYRSMEQQLAELLQDCDVPEDEVEDHEHGDFELLDAGYFSSVWAVPGNPNEVLKISHRPEDACRHYMKWVYEKPHPNAPKIYGITEIGNKMFVRMKRYYPISEMPDNVGAVLYGQRKPSHLHGHEQLCATIHREFSNYRFDLHSGNIMQDEDGRFIITDPVSFSPNYSREDEYVAD
jgi:hypothetical protein